MSQKNMVDAGQLRARQVRDAGSGINEDIVVDQH